MERVNRRVGLPLFQMEEGIVVTSFLVHGRIEFLNQSFGLWWFGLLPRGGDGRGVLNNLTTSTGSVQRLVAVVIGVLTCPSSKWKRVWGRSLF